MFSNLNAYTKLPDGSFQDNEGNFVFFSFDRFKNEICKQGHCFVCGSPPNNGFNKEHVFPNWLLRHCRMHNEELTLPNGERIKYGTYKIPCCKSCNTKLAEVYEKPISKAICGGYDDLVAFLQNGGANLLHFWLSLIFTKVHLRDFQNRAHLDLREKDEKVGEFYDLHDLHHIHAIARASMANVHVEDDVFGTLNIFPKTHSDKDSTFDYCDNLMGRGLLLHIKDIAFVYIVDDCGATASMLSDRLAVLPERLSKIQLREIYARHLAANIHIKESPKFSSGRNSCVAMSKPTSIPTIPKITVAMAKYLTILLSY